MNELISIVVPCYNVENYLRECLDSIKNQTYKNFECIMVNDGSTDSSQQIAEEYLTDSRFKLINQSNQGLGGARNTGISHIREESTFIAFIDSDDYVYPEFLETLIEQIEDDVDIVEGMIEYYYDETNEYSQDETKNCFSVSNSKRLVFRTVEEKLEKLAARDLRVSVFPKLFRKSLLSEDFFPKDWIFEDLAVIPELVSNSRKWIKLQEVIYRYRIRPNSIITSKFSDKKLDVFKICEKYDLFFKDAIERTKYLVDKLKYLHLNYQDMAFVPENNQYKQLYQQEKQKLLSKIADYESKDLISIIVPIYNVEDYLRECLDSIQKQTYQKFECIMVNDGSTDNSKQIAEDFLSDSRFKLINQSHQGVSVARNTAIKYLSANSSFVSFVDSDDYIHSTFLEKMTAQIEEGVDIIEGLFEHYHDGNVYYFPQSGPYKVVLETTVEKLEQLVLEKIRNSNGGKLIRRKILHGSFFPEGWIFEDLAVLTYKQYSMNDGCFYLHVWDQDYYEKYYTGNELLNSLPNLENYDSTFNVSWGKLFKRNFLETATFNEQRIMGEDLEFNFKIFLQIKSCIYLNKTLYNFRQHHLSTRARKISDKYLMDDVEIRLGRLPFLIGKTVDTNLYLAKTKEFLKYHIDNEVEFGIDNTNAIQLYKEIFQNL